ncbi:VOC family protein [Lacinutrix neustonica]|uniref:VOC family protein n=1 Tax=Lacinutrix neustonica TaxID=2980107 RepID=UPI0028BF2633|nr:VOC family protein [Lacinutrix neustonica]
MKVQAYLSFSGNCQEALNYYSDLFNAKVINRQTYEDKKVDVPSSYREKLQHAELKGDGLHFMAYDVSPDTPLNSGNQIHMSIEASSKNEGKALFEKLSSGGGYIMSIAKENGGILDVAQISMVLAGWSIIITKGGSNAC